MKEVFTSENAPPLPQQVQVALPSNPPRVTYTIMGITILFFLLQKASELFLGYDYPSLFGAKVNEWILLGDLWRLITPLLLHGGIMHIGVNMYSLFIIGVGMERRMGHLRFLMLYLVSGFAGNVFSFYFTVNPSVGASTAIFGLLAAEGVFLYFNKDLFGERGKKAFGNIISVALFNLVLGMSAGIDNWGHLGGLLGGIIYAWFGGPRWEVKGIPPLLYVEDQHELRDSIIGAVVVFGIFGAMVLMKFF